MSESILVTGGAGFLGSHVADCLGRDGNRVVVLDDLSGGFRDNVSTGIEFVQGSILDQRLLDGLFADHRFDHVYHLAAYAAEGLSHFIRGFNYTNNLVGSVNLINRAVNHRVKSFVFTSSIAVYGPNQVPMREEATPEPEDPYGIAKLAVEQDLAAAKRLFGLNSVVFRPHNIYGERQNIGDPYRNVIGIFMNQIMSGKAMTVFGDGTQTRAFTYVGDIAPVIAAAHRTERAYGQVFNIGADRPYDLNYLARAVAAEMKAEPRIEYLPARQEVQHAFSSHEKVRQYFSCPPDTALEGGLKAMCHWANSVGARRGKKFANIEIPTGMPPSWQALMSDPDE
jgi:UDP-glucose 4-epimerase